MRLSKAYDKAEIVVRILGDILATELPFANEKDGADTCQVTVMTFHNGRENGFVVLTPNFDNEHALFICEHRSSDSITVTVAQNAEWTMLTDEEYSNRIYYNSEDYVKAARFVATKIKSGWESWKEKLAEMQTEKGNA